MHLTEEFLINVFFEKKKNIAYSDVFLDELMQSQNIQYINDFLLSKEKPEVWNNFNVQECAYMLKKGLTSEIKCRNGQNIWFFIHDIPKAKIFYEYNKNIDECDNKGNVPVLNAKVEMLKFFISKGVKLDYHNKKGCNLLWFSGAKETRVLLNNGVDIHHLNHKGETCLFKNSEFTIEDLMEHYLLDKAKCKVLLRNNINVNITNNRNVNALSQIKDIDMILLLVDAGINTEGYNLPEKVNEYIAKKQKGELIISLSETPLKEKVKKSISERL